MKTKQISGKCKNNSKIVISVHNFMDDILPNSDRMFTYKFNDDIILSDTNSMFYGCHKLSELDLSNLDTSKVVDMCYMFRGCENLTELDLSNFDMNNVEDTRSMFKGCNKLKTIYVTNCNVNTVEKIKHAVAEAGLSETIIKVK